MATPRIDNDEATVRRLVEENQGLMGFAIKHFELQPGRGQTLDDVQASAWYGLLRAAQTYRPKAGSRFSTYAVLCIRRAVYLDCGRRPYSDHHKARRYGRRMVPVEMADAAGGRVDPGPSRLADREQVEHLMTALDPLRRRVIEARFLEGRTLQEVAQQMRMGRRSLIALQRQALAAMRKAAREEVPRG